MDQKEFLKSIEKEAEPFKVSQHTIVKYWERFDPNKKEKEVIAEILNDINQAIEIPHKWVSRITPKRLLSPKADKYLWNNNKIYVIRGQKVITVFSPLEQWQIARLSQLQRKSGLSDK